MAQNNSFVLRGLILLGLMLILATVVGFILFRPQEMAPQVPAKIAQMKPSAPGWEVRYNATVALSRRGSAKLPCDVLTEMLDEDQQMRNFLEKMPDGTEFVDEHAARRTVSNALKAIDIWLDHTDAVKAVTAAQPAELRQMYAAIDKLTQNSDPIIRSGAVSVKKKTS